MSDDFVPYRHSNTGHKSGHGLAHPAGKPSVKIPVAGKMSENAARSTAYAKQGRLPHSVAADAHKAAAKAHRDDGNVEQARHHERQAFFHSKKKG